MKRFIDFPADDLDADEEAELCDVADIEAAWWTGAISCAEAATLELRRVDDAGEIVIETLSVPGGDVAETFSFWVEPFRRFRVWFVNGADAQSIVVQQCVTDERAAAA